MLYKQLLTQYGASLSGPPRDPMFDTIHAVLAHHTGADSDLISFRRRILGALGTAKAFFLSERAADYVDHLGSTLSELQGDLLFMRNILVPEEAAWIEFDAQALARAQVRRGMGAERKETDFGELNIRGLLLDNRDPDRLFAWSFRRQKNGSIIDPLITEEFRKDRAGFPILETHNRTIVEHNFRYINFALQRTRAGQMTSERELIEADRDDFVNLYMRAYGLFSSLGDADSELNLAPKDPFTAKERKTAAKFGKWYIANAPMDHVMVEVGG